MGKRLEELKKDSYYIKEIGEVAQRIRKFLEKANRGYEHLLTPSCTLDFSRCGNGDFGPAYGISMSHELQKFYGPSGGRRGC